MIRRIALAALMLIMAPAFAFAGVYSIAVNTGAASGSVAPAPLSGYATGIKTFTATPATNYVVSKVTRNGVDVTLDTTYVNGSTITIPVSTSTQTFYVSFGKTVQATPSLNAVLPASITIPAATPTVLSGAASTITNLNGNQATFTFSGTNLTFTPASGNVTNPINVTTMVSAASAGTYTGTLTLSASGATASVANVTITVQAPGVIASNACLTCHSGYPEAVAYATSVHSLQAVSSCQGCHNGSHPSRAQCATCHSEVGTYSAAAFASTCQACHGSATADVHTFQANAAPAGCTPCHGQTGHKTIAAQGCIGCHSVNAPAHTGSVNDNNGVRAVVAEFGKWSHHVTGVTLDNAHCAACHLEGKVSRTGGIEVDNTYHMVGAVTHLRNADTDADMAWDPAAPNHSTMDNFCMSCHDANGATSPVSQAIQSYINSNGIAAAGKVASAKNPFGDTISNQYDKMQRPAVVDVSDQFNTANNSHHGVKGPRYTGRTRLAGPRQIASVAAFTINSSATLPGARNTIFDAGKFNSLYVPLQNAGGEAAPRTGAQTLGDDSTLHCGDCHTVGQWQGGSSTNADGSATPVAIGAHGSTNEYLLRNTLGTDARHQGIPQTAAKGLALDTTTPLLVCYNCHKVTNYGTAAHVGEQVSENNCNMATNTNTVNATGTDRLMSQYTKTIGTLVAGANSGASYSNIYGIQCNNCHNSGISAGNIFGGIHGSADPTYIDGAGNITKHERFLPGLGNVMYVPGTRGGITGGTVAFQSYSSKIQTSGISKGLTFKGTYSYVTGGVTNDTNWEEKARIPVGDGVTVWSHNPGAAGCYTISAGDDEVYNAEGNGVPGGPAASKGLAAPDGTPLFGSWGGCDDHSQQAGASVRPPRNNNTSIRPISY